MRRNVQLWVLGVVIASGSLAACSGGGDGDAAPQRDTEYCQELLEIQGIGVATNEDALDLVDELRGVAPEEHQADLTVLREAVAEVAELDPDGTPTPGAIMVQAWDAEQQEDFQTSLNRLMESAIAECGFDPDGPPTLP